MGVVLDFEECILMLISGYALQDLISLEGKLFMIS